MVGTTRTETADEGDKTSSKSGFKSHQTQKKSKLERLKQRKLGWC
ncbi:hypothetical protein AtNW77_Chr4g0285191 [Arabidopsis thaliana]